MARIRTIKPEFWTSEQVMTCSRDARLLFIGMWNFADDAGIHPASPVRLKAQVFPGDDISTNALRALVDELKGAELISEYEADGRAYWVITGWHHQKIDRPSYKHPKPPVASFARQKTASPEQNIDDQSPPSSRTIPDHSSNDRRKIDDASPPEGKGREG